jgi:hypothetical protein
MSGCWVTWQADIRTRPDITDIETDLDQAIYLLWQHRDVNDAYHRYDPATHTVTFDVRVRYGISEVLVRRLASTALRQALRGTGFAVAGLWPTSPDAIARLRFTPWPQAFTWR